MFLMFSCRPVCRTQIFSCGLFLLKFLLPGGICLVLLLGSILVKATIRLPFTWLMMMVVVLLLLLLLACEGCPLLLERGICDLGLGAVRR